jgi:hypothetical protein
MGRIFGPKRDEETGGWKKVHNEVVVWTGLIWLKIGTSGGLL